jgi:hypothetical protein
VEKPALPQWWKREELIGQVPIAIFLEHADHKIVKQATATCISVTTKELDDLDLKEKKWNVLVTAAHNFKVPVPPEGEDVLKFGIAQSDDIPAGMTADDMNYFNVRAIVVFGYDQGRKNSTYLNCAWKIVGGTDRSAEASTSAEPNSSAKPSTSAKFKLRFKPSTSATPNASAKSSTSAEPNNKPDTSADNSNDTAVKFLENDKDYSICPGFNYFKPYRRHVDFALIDIRSLKPITHDESNNESDKESEENYPRLEKVYGDKHFRDVETMGPDFVPEERLKHLGLGLKVTGFSYAPMYQLNPFLPEMASWEEHRTLLCIGRHPLFARKFHVVERMCPRLTWEGEEQNVEWKVPLMEREYTEPPRKDRRLANLPTNVNNLFVSLRHWDGKKAKWNKKPVTQRELVNVGKHVLLGQLDYKYGDRVPHYESFVTRMELNAGSFCGGAWSMSTEQERPVTDVVSQESKDGDREDEKTRVPPPSEGLIAPPTTAGLLVPPTTEGLIASPTSEGSIVPPTSDGLIAPPTTEGLIVPPATEGLIVPPTTEGLIVPPITEGAIVPPITEGLIAPSTSEGLIAPRTSEGAIVYGLHIGGPDHDVIKESHLNPDLIYCRVFDKSFRDEAKRMIVRMVRNQEKAEAIAKAKAKAEAKAEENRSKGTRDFYSNPL